MGVTGGGHSNERAATRIMTPYMANVAVVWVWLTIVQKKAHHHINVCTVTWSQTFS